MLELESSKIIQCSLLLSVSKPLRQTNVAVILNKDDYQDDYQALSLTFHFSPPSFLLFLTLLFLLITNH